GTLFVNAFYLDSLPLNQNNGNIFGITLKVINTGQNCNVNCPNITLNGNTNNVTSPGGSDGSISLNISGGAPPYAYLWSHGSTVQNQSNLVEGTYSVTVTDTNGCSVSGTFIIIHHSDLVWPGDANDDLVASNYDMLTLGMYYGMSGPPRDSISNLWVGFAASNWNDTIYTGSNMKHADCNGDGVINDADTLAIVLNYGLTHPRSGGIHSRAGEPVLKLQPRAASYQPGELVQIDVVLGDENNEVNGFYGVAFDLSLDPAISESGTIELIYNSSFIGNTNNTLILSKAFESTGKVD